MSLFAVGALGVLAGAAAGALATVLLRRPRAPAETPPPTAPPEPAGTAGAGEVSRLAALAHELGGPLTAILAFADDLLKTNPGAEQREALLVIRHQARRARLLIRGLLDTLRPDPQPGAAPQLVNPRRLVEQVAVVAERACAARGITFEREIEPGLPDLPGSEAELEEVLGNLLQNACQATPAGGAVRLSARVRGRLLEFAVRDTGPGIPAEVLPHIFEPFYTTKASHEGTGLGLAISQGIVRRHRGVLTAENLPPHEGGGARFTVALPFEDRRWRDREAIPDEIGPVVPLRQPGRRVLLVEDEVLLRRTLRRYLERSGWVVEETGDGRAALAELLPERGECRFDAIVSDIRLPGLTGMTLYERVLQEAPHVARRMILVTGNADAPQVPEFRRRSGARVMEKPYRLDAMVRLLEEVAADPEGAAPAGPPPAAALPRPESR